MAAVRDFTDQAVGLATAIISGVIDLVQAIFRATMRSLILARRSRHNDRRPPAGTWLLGGVSLLDRWREATLLAVAAWTIRHWRGIGVTVASAAVGIWLGSWLAALVVLVLLVLLVFLTRRRGKRCGQCWHHDVLAPAMVSAGILRAPEGERGKSLSYRGKPVHTDHGTTVVVGLPDA